MRVHALLPEESYRRLLGVAEPRHEVVRLSFARELVQAFETGNAEACVIDPTGRRPGILELLVKTIEMHDCPVLIYAAIDKANIADILELQRCSAARLLLRGIDEQPELLRIELDQLGRASPSPLVLRDLAPALLQLPAGLRSTCIELFGGVDIPGSVPAFFQRAGVEERTGNRWMNRAGVVSAERLLASVRILHSWDDIHDHTLSLSRIAERAGFGTDRSLSAAYHVFCGLPPRRAARELSTGAFAARIVASVCPPRI
jgi:AraC-like DNA-binding protein